LNFPLVAGTGQLSEAALLKLFVAPDWSGERPIMTAYLNEQIVAALRLKIGENDVSVPLPESMLRFSNTLRVAIERAGRPQYCAATDLGQAAQLLPGSGLVLGQHTGSGFLRAASGFARKGEIALPPGAADLSVVGPYLQMAARILASFSSRVGELTVVFGVPSSIESSGVIHFETVGQTGLILAVADQVDRRDIRIEVDSPIAVLTAEPDGRTLRVQLADMQSLPAPNSLYLGAGSRAIVGDAGVIWQGGVRSFGPTFAQQLQALAVNVINQQAIAVVLIAIVVVVLLLVSRAIIKTVFRALRRANRR
jgi:hypothetical protein